MAKTVLELIKMSEWHLNSRCCNGRANHAGGTEKSKPNKIGVIMRRFIHPDSNKNICIGLEIRGYCATACLNEANLRGILSATAAAATVKSQSKISNRPVAPK